VPDVALVCGAGGALGRSLVATFLARGDRVVAADRHGGPPAGEVPNLQSLRREAVDLSLPDDVEALWERLSEQGELPRWVVNAVGGFRPGTVAASEPDEVRAIEELNLGTAWWSCRAAARRLQPGGAIVNVSSRSAVAGGSGAAAYSVAKAAVVRLTEVVASELAERRVRANAILPSVIDTPANRAGMSAARMAQAVPPDDIAAVAAFLCSDGAAAITGAAIPVYGWA
jgi:NAD(P)-dependent dehydrogenase (short-subunit alcohol dehydrogenase family)